MTDLGKQSHEEWVAEYDRFEGPKRESRSFEVLPATKIPCANKHHFRFTDHRTTRQGRLVMVFERLDDGLEVVRFFNVSLQGKKSYPAGSHGQFNPPSKGTFRKFWMNVVGKQPERWCRVHKSMRSHLRDIVFSGEFEKAVGSKGQPYYKFTHLPEVIE